MKLVVVEQEQAPEQIDVVDDDFIIVDHKLWWNLEVGDMLQILDYLGTYCYIVVDVMPQDPHGDRFVRLAEAPTS